MRGGRSISSASLCCEREVCFVALALRLGDRTGTLVFGTVSVGLIDVAEAMEAAE